ncbi:MAG: hypothetical protein C5B51_07865 [Terriglobia bacterium]|nr:MAG: hypothetical protein C5B51_07865 [Terriglobia bacterium]
MDRATEERLHAAFFPGGETWDRRQAVNRLEEAMRQQDFTLALDKKGFEILHKPLKDSDAALLLGTSSRFVEFGVIRHPSA